LNIKMTQLKPKIKFMNTINKESEINQCNISGVTKRIDFKADEIAFLLKLLQHNIDFAPEENTQNEIDLTVRIQTKLIM